MGYIRYKVRLNLLRRQIHHSVMDSKKIILDYYKIPRFHIFAGFFNLAIFDISLYSRPSLLFRISYHFVD